ncbi:hypothetical protein AAC387_Pa12g0474 [Persea americana]
MLPTRRFTISAGQRSPSLRRQVAWELERSQRLTLPLSSNLAGWLLLQILSGLNGSKIDTSSSDPSGVRISLVMAHAFGEKSATLLPLFAKAAPGSLAMVRASMLGMTHGMQEIQFPLASPPAIPQGSTALILVSFWFLGNSRRFAPQCSQPPPSSSLLSLSQPIS